MVADTNTELHPEMKPYTNEFYKMSVPDKTGVESIFLSTTYE